MPTALSYGVPLASALLAFAMALFLLLALRGSAFHRRLAPVLMSAGVLELGSGLAYVRGADVLVWQRVTVAGAGLLGASLMWLGASITEEESAGRWRLRARVALALSAVFVAAALTGVYFAPRADVLTITPVGRLAYMVLTICLVLALARIEAILRSTRDPQRYRIKFVLVGVGAIAAFCIYGASQVLLFGRWPATDPAVGAMATLLSLVLVGLGLLRSRLRHASERVAISPQMVYGSLTVMIVGLYLLVVGAAGYLIRLSGSSIGGALSQLIVFVAALALVVAAFSRATRLELRRLVARHFLRSRHDYRTKWREVTDAFEASASEESILDRLLHLLSQTFGARRISVWLRFDADQRFHRVGAVNTEPAPAPLEGTHPVVAALESQDEPLVLGEEHRRPAEAFLAATQAVLCVPIRAGRDLIGFIALSDAPRVEPYGEDDRDLLRAITRHVAVLIAHARLAEERRASAELEALHRFSAFCMHDLKNLAARLSLVTQNAAVHGKDPAFGEAAMKTVEHTGREMTALIAQLSLPAPERGHAQPIEVATMLAAVLASIDPGLTRALTLPEGPAPRILGVRDQLEQVILNVVLNARHALASAGRGLGPEDFSVMVERREGRVVMTVTDRGVGIRPEKLRTLFNPLRTTKPGGLGIGLYQSRRLVEANQGRLVVESDENRGTRVRIELPMAPTLDAGVPRSASAPS